MGRNLLQVFSAFWTAGELGFTPLIAPLLPVSLLLVGSGKFGTPFARMQTANLSWAALIWMLCAWLTGLATASDLQSLEAAWYAGDCGLMPSLGPLVAFCVICVGEIAWGSG